MRPLRRRFRAPSPAAITAGALVVAFVAQAAFFTAGRAGPLFDFLTPSPDAFRHLRVWTLLSYALLHENLVHVLFNAAALYSLAGYVCEERGPRRYVSLLLAGAFAGGVFWSLVWALPRFVSPALGPPPALVGASAALFAVLGYWLADKLRETLRIFLFFVIPVSLEGGWILAVIALVSAAGFVFGELPAATGWWKPFSPDGVAHSAHLAGLVVGFLLRRRELRVVARTASGRVLRVLRPEAAPRPHPAPLRSPSRPESFGLREEVDRILDKINADGLGSLTPAERATLDRAREALPR